MALLEPGSLVLSGSSKASVPLVSAGEAEWRLLLFVLLVGCVRSGRVSGEPWNWREGGRHAPALQSWLQGF